MKYAIKSSDDQYLQIEDTFDAASELQQTLNMFSLDDIYYIVDIATDADIASYNAMLQE